MRGSCLVTLPALLLVALLACGGGKPGQTGGDDPGPEPDPSQNDPRPELPSCRANDECDSDEICEREVCVKASNIDLGEFERRANRE